MMISLKNVSKDFNNTNILNDINRKRQIIQWIEIDITILDN